MDDKPIIEKTFSLLACTECGSKAFASCNCGKPYAPKSQLAARAIADNPNLSNRAIADAYDLSEPTVRRARTASADAVDQPRTGLDGKTRKLPMRRRENLEE